MDPSGQENGRFVSGALGPPTPSTRRRCRGVSVWTWICVIVGFGVVYGLPVTSAGIVSKVSPSTSKRSIQDGVSDVQNRHAPAATKAFTSKPALHFTVPYTTRRATTRPTVAPHGHRLHSIPRPGGGLQHGITTVEYNRKPFHKVKPFRDPSTIRAPTTSPTFPVIPTHVTDAPVNTVMSMGTTAAQDRSTSIVEELSDSHIEKLTRWLSSIMAKTIPESRCDVSTVVNANLDLPPQAVTVVQDPSVDSLYRCQEACLDPVGSSGVLGPGGTTCHGGIFYNATRRCLLTSYGSLYEHAQSHLAGNDSTSGGPVEFVSFYNTLICYSTTAPGCNSRGIKWINRRPYPFIYSEGISGNATLADCIQGCNLMYRHQGAAPRCYGFTYDTHNMSCTYVTSYPGRHLEEQNGTEFYSYNIRSECDMECHDAFPMVTPHHAASTNPSSTGLTPSVYKCRDRCETYHTVNPAMCYGFDYSAMDNVCSIITDRDYELQPRTNTSNFRRHVRCNDCPHGVSYMSTMDTALPWSPSLRTLYTPYLVDCERHCRNSAPGAQLNASTCQGFTYDHTTKECVLTGDYWQEISALGKSDGIDLYRRSYLCDHPSVCQETYTKVTDMSAKLGILQPADINTVSRCSDRCRGFDIAVHLPCYGFDFGRLSSRCYIHIKDIRDRMVAVTAVDSYVSDMRCKRLPTSSISSTVKPHV